MPKLAGENHVDAVRAVSQTGFRILRQGKHILMTDGVRILTNPRHNPVHANTRGTLSVMRRSRTMSSERWHNLGNRGERYSDLTQGP